MIQTTLADVVAPSSTIDALTVMKVVCQRGQGATEEVTALKATITELRRNVDQLESTDISMLFGMVEIPDVPVEPNIPPVTTRDVVRADEVSDPEFEAEMDEEILGVAEEMSYEGLTET
ncbi:uncharacterized protein LOC125861599 [Solanum stenotomum]|uniref:uncharacterized protein LOC125861599 n=1 Tax=Solanum stenotomum TaxID=172797 RepID=UPI0020D112CB|nr:uncharacterized protein LOC125861599 [Solanum stenotomum]